MTSYLIVMVDIGKRLVEALAIAIVYIATAQLGFLAAIPPGNVTVVWPPSGIALAAMLLLGYRAWAGVWLGSFLVNVLFFVFHDALFSTAVTAASSIAAGSTLQAFLAAFLYRRMIGPGIPHELKGVFNFMTLATLSCLVAPTVGMRSLVFSSAATWADYTDTWLTWWLGDLVGILTVAPVLLMVGYRVRQGQGIKYWAFPLISGGVGLTLIAGYSIWNQGEQAMAAYLGVSPAWLSWGVFATGLLLAALLAFYMEYYLGIEAALHESEEHSRRQLLELETLYRTAPIGLALVDRDLRFLRINEMLAEIDGTPMDAHIGHTLREVVPGVADAIEPLYRRVIETGEPVLHIEIHGTTPAQPYIERDWLADYYPLKEPDGSVQAVGTIVVEITARKRTEEALFNEKERAEVTLHCIGDGVITTDPSCRVEYLNPVAEALTGWTTEEARRKPVEVIFNIIEGQSYTPVPNPVARCLKDGTIVGLANQALLISRSGQEHAIEDSVAPIRSREGAVLGAVLVFHDVSETRRMAQQLQHDAAHDALTGLINRREFEGRLARAVASAKRYGLHHALCYFDLDQFKLVNDTAGHAAGDALLKGVRGLLSGRFRERDTLARFGGDEFALLLENCGLDEAIRIAEIIVATFREWRFVWNGLTFHVGASVGVVAIDSDVESAAQLLSQADVACYAAKERGRNRVDVYRKDGTEPSPHHAQILVAARLREALEQNRFRLFCHPIVELSGDASRPPLRYELLIRLLEVDGRLVLPKAFIPAAERYGLMSAIDRWVIETAFRAYASSLGASQGVEIAINLSGDSLNDDDFPKFLREQFETVSPDRVCFEITETAAIHNLDRAIDFLTEIKKGGTRVALDDFGSGLSSFTYLRLLPADYLKIDGSFVRDMLNSPRELALVAAINEVGHTLGIATIAEYAHSTAIVNRLRQLGVDCAQGYAFGAPVPLEDLLLELGSPLRMEARSPPGAPNPSLFN
jgi:diguanylate cyclase (GGDEF)-like protein/PAS domain S-box-containing protein